MKTTNATKTLALALLMAGSALADVNFYYTIEAPPFSFTDGDPHGILVLVRDGNGATVCAATAQGQTCGTAVDDGYGYASVRLDTGNGEVDSISVELGGDTKTVAVPVAGMEY